MFDFQSQPSAPMAIPGLELKVCSDAVCEPEYPRCGTEVGECYQVSLGDAANELVIDFPYDFSNGVLRFSAPGYAEMHYVLGGPMVGTPGGEMTVRGLGVPLVSEESRAVVYQDVGVPAVDPTRGVLVIRALDCRGERASGVQVQPRAGNVESPAVAFALSGSNAVTVSSLVTDPRGVVGFVNVAPQPIDVVALTPGGETFVSPTTIDIHPNVIALAELRMGLGMWGQ